jgi:hypothetical protein
VISYVRPENVGRRRFWPALHSAHIQATPAIGHDSHSNHLPRAGVSNNLQPTSVGMRVALSHAVGLRKVRQMETTDAACRLEITDVANRIP